jgi:hypothetical protein
MILYLHQIKIESNMETYKNNLDTDINNTPKIINKAEVYKAYSRKPEVIDPSILNQLSDLINGFSHLSIDKSELNDYSVIDRLNDAITITYIMLDSEPVACAILLDPNEENYKGIIPKNYYELKSGYPLDDMMQQEYFVVKSGYEGKGLAKTLRDELRKVSDNMFVVVNAIDTETLNGLENNGYTKVASFVTDWEDSEMVLYIN